MVVLFLLRADWNVLYLCGFKVIHYTCVFDIPNLAGGRPDESLTSSDSEKAVSVCMRVCVCVRVYLFAFVGMCAVVHSVCMLTGVKANATQMFDLSDCF